MSTGLDILSSNRKHCFNPSEDNPDYPPDQKGIYMICAKNRDCLEKIMVDVVFPELDGLPVIYIGISETQGLRKRDYQTHFKGTARKSTLRKSLGSLFKWQADRLYDKDDKRYKFKPDFEQKLSIWMQDNLIMYYWLIDTGLSELETKLINELNPPLNLAKNKCSVNKEFRINLSSLRN